MGAARRMAMISWLGAILLLGLPSSRSAAGDGPAYDPPGKAVGVASAELTRLDEIRGRTVRAVIHVPADASEYPLCPLVILSFDSDSDRGAFDDIVRYLAARGYICAVVHHPDLPPDPKDRRVVRAGDLSFALDVLMARDLQHPLLQGRVDRINAGIVGCGEGASSALDLAGQIAEAGERRFSLRDMRVRAALALAPSPAGLRGEAGDVWSRVRIPVLTIGGSSMVGSGDSDRGWGCAPFENMPGGHKYHLCLRGPLCGAGTPSRPDRWWRGLDGRRRGWTLQTMIAFLDDHLRDIRRAGDWLESDAPERLTGSEARLLRK